MPPRWRSWPARSEGAPLWGVLRGRVDDFAIRLRRTGTVEELIQISILYKQFFAGELEVACSMRRFLAPRLGAVRRRRRFCRVWLVGRAHPACPRIAAAVPPVRRGVFERVSRPGGQDSVHGSGGDCRTRRLVGLALPDCRPGPRRRAGFRQRIHPAVRKNARMETIKRRSRDQRGPVADDLRISDARPVWSPNWATSTGVAKKPPRVRFAPNWRAPNGPGASTSGCAA